MSRHCLCVLLCASVALSGCATVDTRSRPTEGETGSLKVAVYWRDAGGERHSVGGLDVALAARDPWQPALRVFRTSPHHPIVFERLPPGRYLLRISEGDKEYASDDLSIHAGREVSARVNVTGRILGQAAAEAGKDTAEAVGKAVVIIAAVAFIVGIAYLDMTLEEGERRHSSDDAALIEINLGKDRHRRRR